MDTFISGKPYCNSNGIYFDIVEKLAAVTVVNKGNGTTSANKVFSKIDVNCNLSGAALSAASAANSRLARQQEQPTYISHRPIHTPSMCSVCIHFLPPVPYPSQQVLRPSTQTRSLRTIESTLLCLAGQAFHALGIPLRPFSKQIRGSPSSHNRSRAGPSVIHAARIVLHHRPRRTVLLFPTAAQLLTPGTRPVRAVIHPAGVLEDVSVELYLGSGAMGLTSTCATGGSDWVYVLAHRKTP
ncbi:hypothetical protein EI94DRAFT_1804214 [Lactarius quietus]|nr:hypothetical protein EI94DRAFT_1804214 [Lactarius quietus]